MRMYLHSILLAFAVYLAGAVSAQAQDATAALGFANGDVGAISAQALSGVAGDQLRDNVVATATSVAGNNSSVGVPAGVTPTPIGLEIVTPQVGGMRVLGAGIIGTRTHGSGIY